MIDSIFARSPIKFLNDAITQNRYIEGVVFSVVYLEHFGIEKLKQHFNSEGVTVPNYLKRLSFPSIMRILKKRDIINSARYIIWLLR